VPSLDVVTEIPLRTQPANGGFAARAMQRALAVRRISCHPDQHAYTGALSCQPCIRPDQGKSPLERSLRFLRALLILAAPLLLTETLALIVPLMSSIGTFNSAVPLQKGTMIATVTEAGSIRVNNFG